jgi:uncharacterized protein YihD (DUF1040 family)
MRNPERIPEILEKMRQVWEASPDMRLGQLLINVAGREANLWNLEDDVLLDDLVEWVDTSKNWSAR